jgi:carboxypeptidase family protein
MSTSRTASFVVLVVGGCLFLPVATAAQVADTASIAGVVRDVSGAVLPGVSVEAASPALIDKVRAAVSDGQGLYRFVDLRPGIYSVKFSLPGFSTFERAGLELTTGFTATVNAELKVGSVEETITVSGETPVVDISNVRQQTTLSRETLDVLPTSGRISQLANLIPGAVLGNPVWQSVGGLDERANAFAVHGGRFDDNVPVMNGLPQRLQGGAVFVFNQLTFQEVVVETGGMSAERNTGGVQMNIVPKDGGNTFSGSFSTSHTTPDLQSNNLTDELRARGLGFSPSLKKHYDTGGAIGGPIVRDRLWFFNAYRFGANQQYQQGNYFNKLQNERVGADPVWRVTFYEPDLNRPASTNDFYRDYSLRLTWQAAAKHKIVASYQVQPNCSCFWPLLELGPQQGVQGTPEAVGAHNYKVNYLPLVSWTYPATNRLLIEAGASANVFDNNTLRTDPSVGLDTIAITELSTNFRYGSRGIGLTHAGGYRVQHNRQYRQRFSVSYITGAHAFKAGVDGSEYTEGAPGKANDANQINGARSYTFRDRVPQQVTIWAVPFEAVWRSRDIAAYVQDQWTVRKLSLTLGVRFNNFNGTAPETHLPAGPWVPARDLPERKNAPNWSNLSPRLGAAYDLFGTGKTALKVSLGRYTPYSIAAVDVPANNQASNTARTWNDANRNYVPDCDLRNPVADGECGAWSDLTFGQIRAGNTRRAQDALGGFNGQEHNWQGSVSLQHELRPNVALNVGYFRTWYGGFLMTDNQALTAADYDPFCITVPGDSRLSGGGGNQVCGLYDIKPAAFGRVDNVVTQAARYGKQTEVYNGVDVGIDARFPGGAQLGAGLGIGRTVTDTCDFNDLPQMLPLSIAGVATVATVLNPRLTEFCRISRPWTSATGIKLLAIYPLPWDFQVSATYFDKPGIPVAASRAYTNAEIRPSLGRDLGQCRGAATCNATLVINMVPPDTEFEERLQQMDVRFSRAFRGGGMRVRANADVYNLFNASNVLNMTTRFAGLTGGQWLQPIQILGGRMFKFSGQLDF